MNEKIEKLLELGFARDNDEVCTYSNIEMRGIFIYVNVAMNYVSTALTMYGDDDPIKLAKLHLESLNLMTKVYEILRG